MKTIKCGSYHCKGGHKWINGADGPRLNPMVCGSGLSREFVERKLKELDEDEKAFIKEDASELIGELEGLIQRMEE